MEIENKEVSLDKKGARKGYGFRPQSQRLTGGVVNTSTQPTRVEMDGKTNTLIIYKDGEPTISLEEGQIVFLAEGPNGWGLAGDISALGDGTLTNLFINGIGAVIQVSGSPTPATNDLYDLGIPASRWRTIYLINSPQVSSDIRFKDNIRPLSYSLDTVKQIDAIAYERDGDTNLGFSAQQLREIVPEIVHGNEDVGLSITPDQLIPILINAIKELSDKVDRLESDIMKQT